MGLALVFGNNHTTRSPIRMRVALYHNPTAGQQAYTSGDLLRLLRDAGHEPRTFDENQHKLGEAIAGRPDVVIAAGGDGTVAEAVIALRDRDVDIPLYVLPMGTSNNIAFSLGVRDTVPVLIQALASARQSTLDVGLASTKGAYASFVEAVGAGFFGVTMNEAGSMRERFRAAVRKVRGDEQGEEEVRAAARGMARRIRDFAPRIYTVTADGRDLSGEYLAVEVMNIQAIGPRMRLAPDANHRDGLLDLVLIRPEERASLADTIEAGEMVMGGERLRVREVELSYPPTEGHADDDPWPSKGSAKGRSPVSVRASMRGSINVLLARVGP
jgi:diacylglycerol kinase (ATP)